VVLAVVVYAVLPVLFAWMSPVVLGLVLVIPISAVTGWQALGKAVRKLGLLVTPKEIDPPAVLRRANELTRQWATTRPPMTDALTHLARDAQLRTLHAMLLPTTPEQRQREYDVDLLLGFAKLDDADSLEEGTALLSNREKLAVLGSQTGLERLCQFAMVCHDPEPG
jgi:membrane glycosyltransferase